MSEPIDAASVLKRASLPGSRIDDEMVFFNQQTGTYYGTGLVGAEIWDFLESPKSFSEICDHLLERYDVDRHTCEAQVNTFLTQMIKEGIVDSAE